MPSTRSSARSSFLGGSRSSRPVRRKTPDQVGEILDRCDEEMYAMMFRREEQPLTGTAPCRTKTQVLVAGSDDATSALIGVRRSIRG